jgi:hypothetical protein
VPILNAIGPRVIGVLTREGVSRATAMLEQAVTVARHLLDHLLRRVDPGIMQG